MKLNLPVLSLVSGMALMSTAGHDPLRAQEKPVVNIALGKPVEAFPDPNESAPGSELRFLTDGIAEQMTKEPYNGSLWGRPSAVVWRMTSPACIVVDLGSVQPISGFSYHTAAGTADVTWPTSIIMAVSDDKATWRYAGDLIQLSARSGQPPAYGDYHEYTFATHDVKTRGRYVAFGTGSSLYTPVDEVQVFAGEQTWLNEPDTAVAFPNQPDNVLDYMRGFSAKRMLTKRITDDAAAVRNLIDQSGLPQAKKNALSARLAAALKLDDEQPLLDKNFKAIAPVSVAHREILAVYGALLASRKLSPLTVWTQHRFAWLPLLAEPGSAQKPEVRFSMLRNQFRSQALLLTNASDKPQSVSIRLNNTPRGAQSGWLKMDEVAWTDTHQSVVIADALLPSAAKNGVYSLTVPAGMTRKVWLTVDTAKLPAGKFDSSIVVTGNGPAKTVPLKLEILPIAMGRPRMSLGMWDDADSAEVGGGLGITLRNRDAALKLMRSHYVDTAWGKRYSVPWPEAEDFAADGALKKPLDFTTFDKWLSLWPEARRFYCFIYEDDTFAGAKIGTPEFHTRVGNWVREVARHAREKGLKPGQLGFLVVDEQQKDEQDAIVAAWAEAIKAVAPEIDVFADPVWVRPDLAKNQKGITSADVLCLNLPLYYQGGEPVKEYAANLRKQGTELWLYQCTGPVRLFDPQRYYRYQAWHVFSIGGTGQGFWSFGDLGTSKTSWNDYVNSPFLSFAPAFIDVDTVNNSVHWDSVREGVEDFEELAMLRDAIQDCKDAKQRAAAQKVLDDAVKTVVGVWKPMPEGEGRFNVTEPYDWQSKAYDPGIGDRELAKVRAMLLRLRTANHA